MELYLPASLYFDVYQLRDQFAADGDDHDDDDRSVAPDVERPYIRMWVHGRTELEAPVTERHAKAMLLRVQLDLDGFIGDGGNGGTSSGNTSSDDAEYVPQSLPVFLILSFSSSYPLIPRLTTPRAAPRQISYYTLRIPFHVRYHPPISSSSNTTTKYYTEIPVYPPRFGQMRCGARGTSSSTTPTTTTKTTTRTAAGQVLDEYTAANSLDALLLQRQLWWRPREWSDPAADTPTTVSSSPSSPSELLLLPPWYDSASTRLLVSQYHTHDDVYDGDAHDGDAHAAATYPQHQHQHHHAWRLGSPHHATHVRMAVGEVGDVGAVTALTTVLTTVAALLLALLLLRRGYRDEVAPRGGWLRYLL